MSYPSAFPYSISKPPGWSHIFGAQLTTCSFLGLAVLLLPRGSKETANCSPASSSVSSGLPSLCNIMCRSTKGFPLFLYLFPNGSNCCPLENVPVLPFLAYQSPGRAVSRNSVGQGQGDPGLPCPLHLASREATTSHSFPNVCTTQILI